MCELLVASFDEPHPFADVALVVAGLERYGVAGFGWGVAWLEESAGDDHVVHEVRGLHRYRDEGHRDALLAKESRRFLVHLRRPSQLSTVQMADTQPFVDSGRSAWGHNGYLEQAERFRETFAGRLHGRADSEVGWQFFLDRMVDGLDALDALRAVNDTFGGKVNLAYLAATGELCIYSRNETNRMWTFDVDGGRIAATDLHSADSSLFDLVVPRASARQLVEPGTALRLAGPVEHGAARSHAAPSRESIDMVHAGDDGTGTRAL